MAKHNIGSEQNFFIILLKVGDKVLFLKENHNYNKGALTLTRDFSVAHTFGTEDDARIAAIQIEKTYGINKDFISYGSYKLTPVEYIGMHKTPANLDGEKVLSAQEKKILESNKKGNK